MRAASTRELVTRVAYNRVREGLKNDTKIAILDALEEMTVELINALQNIKAISAEHDPFENVTDLFTTKEES